MCIHFAPPRRAPSANTSAHLTTASLRPMHLAQPRVVSTPIAGRRTFKSFTNSRRLHAPVHAAAAAALAAEVVSWAEVSQQAGVPNGFVVRNGKKPSTAPSSTLPTTKDAHTKSIKPVVLYRDGNAWCPYCERVWLALEEKEIQYDSIFIDLQNKPDWYPEVVPTKLVPAASIHGNIVWESKDILLALEEQFPDHRPLMPQDAMLKQMCMELLDEMAKHDVSGTGFKFMAAGDMFGANPVRDESQLPALQAAFESELAWMESQLGRVAGPYFLGDSFSLVDVMFISFMERLAACLPYFRGFQVSDNPAYPKIASWFQAMERRPAYQKVRSDAHTLRLLFKKLGMLPCAAPEPGAKAAAARREAAAKLAMNREAIVGDIIKGAGLLRMRGSPFGTTARSVNGWDPVVSPEVRDAVDLHLRRLANQLLTGSPGPKAPTAAEAGVGAAALAYFRNRASAPRDLSATACEELRAACDAVLQDLF